MYVQDLIREQAELVHHFLHDQLGLIYICGSVMRIQPFTSTLDADRNCHLIARRVRCRRQFERP